ncbi:MAG TPA: alpha/beta fold hydrolase [Steroidobacteraceae bacterium]|nr:alpha/beta fold hydrolase [Steroidobacteraceae bacterium]
MAARFWRCVVGFVLAFAGAAALLVGRRFCLSIAVTAGVGIAVLNAIPLAFVCGSFIGARAMERKRPAPFQVRTAVRAMLSEAGRFSCAILAMSVNPRERKVHLAIPGTEPRPILLIHGILCNRAVWRPLERRLRAAGYGPIVAVDLEPLFADLDLHGHRLGAVARAMQRESSGERVTIVAHSMGGLVARSLLRGIGSEVIDRLITIACPHHGSRFVRGFKWPATQQMSSGSVWLRELNSAQGRNSCVPITSLYSLEDNLVTADSAHLPGARTQVLRGVGHLGMLSSPPSLECVMAALR